MAAVASLPRVLDPHPPRRRSAKRRIVVYAVGLTSEDMAAIVNRITDSRDVVVIRTDWLTPQEAAAYLQVGEDLIKEAFARGLEYSDLGYRTHRTRKTWIDRYAETRRRCHAAKIEGRDEGPIQEP